ICSEVRPRASGTTASGLPPNCRSVKTSTVAKFNSIARLTSWFETALPRAERYRNVVSDESRHIRQRQHITERNCHPPPAPGLASDHGESGGALRRKDVPREQRERRCETPFGGECLADLLRSLLAAFDGVDGSKRCDRDFARRHAGDQGDVDLPVESHRRQNRLKRIADRGGEAVIDRRPPGAVGGPRK